MAALDAALQREDADPDELLCALTFGLLPLAGVDLAAATEYAATYVANFPLAGRALGDLDERAATWLAQLLDRPPARPMLRQLLGRLADVWAEPHPTAAQRVGGWAEEPPPADPTRDEPWMHAMLALARTQL